MNGKNDGNILRQFLQSRKDAQKTISSVDIRRAMQSQERVRSNRVAVAFLPELCPQPQFFAYRRFLSLVLESEQGVDHRVADQVHSVEGNSFFKQILKAAPFRHKEQVGNVVGNDAIDL